MIIKFINYLNQRALIYFGIALIIHFNHLYEFAVEALFMIEVIERFQIMGFIGILKIYSWIININIAIIKTWTNSIF